MECTSHDKCLNNTLCKVCTDCSLLKLKKEYKKPQKYRERQGTDFEKKIIKTSNRIKQKPKPKDAARATINSGAFWMDKADISLEDLLVEAKDRGTEKSMSIKREWLEKVYDESLEVGRLPVLTFQFKDDDTIYAVMRYEDLLHIK
jgi:hypothetical protein